MQFYNKRNYTSQLAPSHTESAHRRSNSISAVTSDDPASHRASIMAAEGDVFPPRRTDFRSYNPDGMIEFWLHEYEDVLSEVFGETLSLGSGSEESDEYDHAVISPGDDAWKRLGEIMRGGRDEEEMSDSESVVSVGELGEDARMDGVMGGPDAKDGHQGENTWEVGIGSARESQLTSSTCRQRPCCFCPAHQPNGAGHRLLARWAVRCVLSYLRT